MRKYLLAGAAVAALSIGAGSLGALAADLPSRGVAPAPVYAAPIFTWSGFYVGLNAGYGFGGNKSITVGGSPLITASQLAGTVPFALSKERDGFIGGGQIGYNIQSGAVVYGVEADFQGADIKSSASHCDPVGGCANVMTTATTKLDWFGTLRGRIGFAAFDRTLLYVTGGLAVGSSKLSANINEFALAGRQFNASSSSSTRAGYTVGAGAEYAFSQNWSAKIEYLYYDLGSRSAVGLQTNPVGPEFATYRTKTDGHIVRVGLNYRFGGAAGPIFAKY
ncbi:porin family protein [Roseiarcaceae bacterium H3SJ34-1]|uniref:outer membrane protein n=1 Tax=Terripilifer ovatus TaxID=3032367 RepID=UPI003AB9569B|nr:porin family protein [Roseiarcaceae bacterium H3SJ34-1]